MSVVHGQVHGTEKKDIEIMHHQIDRMDIHILKLVRRRCFRSSQMIEKNERNIIQTVQTLRTL